MSWVLLLVEDDDDIRDTLASILEARGFQVVAARHGRDAIDQIHKRGTRPALVLLDLLMPVMDGETFLSMQVSDPLLAQVPVVVLTAQLRMPEKVPETVRAVFTKPIALNQIIETVRQI